MNLNTNRRTLTPEKCEKRILGGQCWYCEGFGHVARACPDQHPYGCQLHGNETHIASFQFNVSTAQIAPVAIKADAGHVAPPSFKIAENKLCHVLTIAYKQD
jgi:hypothetical protein